MKSGLVTEHIVSWLKGYVQEARVDGLVVGVSGGIDSAVVSALCARTEMPVVCVEMPIHQPKAQVTRAAEHIDNLISQYNNVSRVEVELTDTFDRFVRSMPDRSSSDPEMPLVNTRARLRMTALYYLAGMNNSLVVGTGNKVEDFGVGFYTKYGDGGVDISPIADLVKSEVYELGKELGVINSILIAPPTDGLWGDDRTDEDQLGASYDELEWAMNANPDQNAMWSDRQIEVFEIYSRLNRINQHKMNPIPVCEIPDELK